VPRSARSNPLALAVLVCLYERPMHPYEVAQTLRSRAKHESVRLNYGSLYAVVDSLEHRGLIRAGETVREGRRPERTVYEITDAGARELTDWLTELIAAPTLAVHSHVFQNREILSLFSEFRSSKTFVGRDQVREALFLK